MNEKDAISLADSVF